ncbi:hypothetical protein D3C76_1278470 [compost metagenome]
MFALVVAGEGQPLIPLLHDLPRHGMSHAVQGVRLRGGVHWQSVIAALEMQVGIADTVGVRHQRISTGPGPVQRVERLGSNRQQQVEPVGTQVGDTPAPGGKQAK